MRCARRRLRAGPGRCRAVPRDGSRPLLGLLADAPARPDLRGPRPLRLPVRGAIAARGGRPAEPARTPRRPAQPPHHPPNGDRRDRRAVRRRALAYGLCGGATAGLRCGAIPLVVPRAHDCITLFLGDRARYQAEFSANPGTYWYVQDYLERTDDGSAFAGVGAVSDASALETYREYVAKYGEDNAAYLMEALGAWSSHYDRAAFVDMGVAAPEACRGSHARPATMRIAAAGASRSSPGSCSWSARLIDGAWDPADYLVLQPGERLAMSYDDERDPGRAGPRGSLTRGRPRLSRRGAPASRPRRPMPRRTRSRRRRSGRRSPGSPGRRRRSP